MKPTSAAGLLLLVNLVPVQTRALDHPRWMDEPGIRNNRIHALKVGRLCHNSVFCYTDTPLDAAESMAFNLNCLGCAAWFEWADLM